MFPNLIKMYNKICIPFIVMTSVYMCMLDASKTFNRVNLLTRFKTLYSTDNLHIFGAIDENLRRAKNTHQIEQHRY